MKEQEQSLNWLGQLKDYDVKLAQELVAKALQEQRNQKLEVKIFFLTLNFGFRKLEWAK